MATKVKTPMVDKKAADKKKDEDQKGNKRTEKLSDGRQPEDVAEVHQHNDSRVELSSELEEDDREATMSDCTELEDDTGGAQGSSSSGSVGSMVTMCSADFVAMVENSQYSKPI